MNESLRVYANQVADELCAPFFEREAGLESAFLSVRAARRAKVVLKENPSYPGAFAVFPVVLYGPFIKNSGCGAAGQWPIRLSEEPGSFYRVGVTGLNWSVDLPFGRIEGSFSVIVTADGEKYEGPDTASCFLRSADGTLVEVPSPLPSLILEACPVENIPAEARRLLLREDEARAHILQASSTLISKVVGRLRGGFTLNVDADDAHQLASLEVLRLIDRFTSPDRPRVSWGRFVALSANRAVVRALEQERRIGRPEKALKRLVEEHPELQGASIQELRAELESSINEASGWSDQRIAMALSGPIICTPVSATEHLENLPGDSLDPASALPIEMLIAAISNDPHFLASVHPFLASEYLAENDESMPFSPRTRRRSRQALVDGVAKALGLNASTPRQLVEAFAKEGESFNKPADRQRMETRARRAVLAAMEREGAA